jgi:hypothetical protein
VGDYDGDLAELRHHWGSAYIINCTGLGRWTAERRDNREVLRSDSAAGLLELIRADYAERPVSRRIAGADHPETPGCRFLPEG